MSGDDLRAIRKRANLTLRQTAAALDLSPRSGFSFVREMESGERPIPLDLTDQIMGLVPLDGEPDSDEVQRARRVAAPRGAYGRRSAS